MVVIFFPEKEEYLLEIHFDEWDDKANEIIILIIIVERKMPKINLMWLNKIYLIAMRILSCGICFYHLVKVLAHIA